MKISVALCTYNGEKFLQKQLESIACQTLLPDELVVCDDRSTDGTLIILETFLKQVFFPVHIHINEENLGSTKNFEKAITLCQGDIIALCDQDDVWKPQKLERLVVALRSNPEAGYVFSDAELVDENLNPLGCSLWEAIRFSGYILEDFLNGEQLQCFIKKSIVTGATMAFRSNLGKLAMPFPISEHWIHDGWIAIVASSIGARGIPINEQLTYYRQHSNQQIGVLVPTEKNTAEVTTRRSHLEMYRELKNNGQYIFQAWETRGLKILSALPIVENKLKEIEKMQNGPELAKNLKYLKDFQTHFLNRRKILKTRALGRYSLILRETFSGRYDQFSDSWRSIFRDVFL